MPTQCAIPPGSVNESRRKLESKGAHHAMQPGMNGFGASDGIQLKANETGISVAQCTHEAIGKKICLL